MNFDDKTTFGDTFPLADKTTILAVMEAAYDISLTAKEMFDDWLEDKVVNTRPLRRPSMSWRMP
jgi:hypothetical protein